MTDSALSTHFPGQPDPTAAEAQQTKLRNAVVAEMVASGINPGDSLIPVRLAAGTPYVDPRSGCRTRTLSENQYQRLEKKQAEERRDVLRVAALDAESAAERFKIEGAELDARIATLEPLDARWGPLRTARANTAQAEKSNRESAKELRAAMKAVKVVPIDRPVRWYSQAEIDAETKRRRDRASGVIPSPFPQRPEPGSDADLGL